MIISTFLIALAKILHTIITLYIWVIIISALISWVQPNPFNPIVQFLYRLTAPTYSLIRRYIPTIIGGVDLAPLIIILILQFIDYFLIQLLFKFANAL